MDTAQRLVDLVIALARVPDADEGAEMLGLERFASDEGVLFVGDAFHLQMLGDGRARTLCASLAEDDDGVAVAERLGITLTDDCVLLSDTFDALHDSLSARLGVPVREDSWRSTCLLHDEEHTYRAAAWRSGERALVLLLDEEGDAHVGELAALDLRLVSGALLGGFPESVRGPIAWPVLDDDTA